jgi:hypothetical protein
VDHWSVPSTVLLAAAGIQRLFGIDLLQRKDRQAAWLFGALAGLLLYPLAVLAVVLIVRRNRFGVVLVLAIAAWHLRAVESGNYWDCLIDPFYFLFSAGALGSWAWRACAKGSRTSSGLAAAESRDGSCPPG